MSAARGRGRPPSYRPTFVEQAQKLARLGATDPDLADFFGVTPRTIQRWRVQHEDFCRATKLGKDAADDRVEKSLYARATGYSYDAVKIMTVAGPTGSGASIEEIPYVEHVPPDVAACIFWLKNRRKGEWRDKVEHEHGGKDGGPIEVIRRVVVDPNGGA